MKRSLFATCVALLTAVVVFPSAASAVELYSGTTKLPLGTSIVAQSGQVKFGQVTCGESKFTGTLETNGIGQPEQGRVNIPLTSSEFKGELGEAMCTKLDGSKAYVVFSEHECLSTTYPTFMNMQPFASFGCSGKYESHYLYVVGPGNSYVCQYARAAIMEFNRVNNEPLEVQVSGQNFKKISGPVLPCWSELAMSARYTISAPGYGPLHFVN